MAKKRTKAEKIKAAARTHEVQQTLPSQQISITLPNVVVSPRTMKNQQIWRFDPSLIYQDLLKTALASALIVGILVLIYWLSF